MKIRIIAVGRGAPEPVRELIADYSGRLKPFGGVEMIEVPDEKRKADDEASGKRYLAKEGEAIAKLLPKSGAIVTLEVGGRRLSSEQLAQTLEGTRAEGVREITFVIGGPDGLDPTVSKNASWSLSLGPMTFPHMLSRVLLLEQLYRAMTIQKGIPYHR